MIETLVVAGILLLALSGVPGLFLGRQGRAGELIATTAVVAGSLALTAGAIASLAGFPSAPWHLRWASPGAELVVQVDALSAMFLVQIAVVGALASIYGLEYWSQRAHPSNGRKLRLFFGTLLGGMAAVVVAGNGVPFLFGWEIMALSAFLALTTVDESADVRAAGYVYLVAAHVATLTLFVVFSMLGHATGTLALGAAGSFRDPALIAPVLLLALLGFGLKAGLVPLHVWLPGAHARAPTHVSAVMSGVLLKMGVYGLLRVCSIVGLTPTWFALLVLGVGIVSAIVGVLFAIGQHDLKRLLAYHSVENIGIITMGIGLALLGRSVGRPDLVTLGLAGALLHTWNHGLFKALLFLGAGSVIHATHTQEIDELGGVGLRMPTTATFFLIGAAAISGLPPLNGFVSELLIYLGLARAVASGSGSWWLAGAVAIPALALVGALAAACFAKAVGAVFLGAPRSEHALHAKESGWRMTVPMGVLASLCVLVGAGPALVAPALDGAVAAFTGAAIGSAGMPRLADVAPLSVLSVAALALLVLLSVLGLELRRRFRAQPPATTVTWDCGYARPAATMQYTSSSFAQMLVRLFGWVLWPSTSRPYVGGAFPSKSSFRSEVPDAVLERLIAPATRTASRVMSSLRWVQGGSAQLYLAYIAVTLVVLLLWRM